MLLAKGEELARLHRTLLPLEEVDFGAEGFGARILPYRSVVAGGDSLEFVVEVRNPFRRPSTLRVDLVVPDGLDGSTRAIERRGRGARRGHRALHGRPGPGRGDAPGWRRT